MIIIIIMAIHLEILNYVNKMLLDYINNKQEKLNHFREILRFFNVNLSLKGSQNFSPQATLTCLAIYILCMAILGGWVPDRLPSRRLFELVAATQCNFLIAARIRVKVRPLFDPFSSKSPKFGCRIENCPVAPLFIRPF